MMKIIRRLENENAWKIATLNNQSLFAYSLTLAGNRKLCRYVRKYFTSSKGLPLQHACACGLAMAYIATCL